MSERMLVTQALDERDLLVKKINDKIQKASFVDTIKPNVELVYNKRIKKEEFNQAASSAYQRSWTSSHVFRPLMQQSSTPMPILRSPHHMVLILLRQLFHSVAG